MRAAAILVFVGCNNAAAFTPSKHGVANRGKILGHSINPRPESTCTSLWAEPEHESGNKVEGASRRAFVEDMLRGSVGFYLASSPTVAPAHASGGATAGGAYLLSAKQRYNKRVTAGIKTFLSLDARDLSQVQAFFASTEEGGWEDLSAAGYLLANAFRTSSTKAPENLPSVKKWKAFAKEIELLQRSLSKKDGEKTFSAYKNAEEKLEAYLEAVELPPAMELKQM